MIGILAMSDSDSRFPGDALLSDEPTIELVLKARNGDRAAVEALNRLEATGTQLLGAILTKASDAGGSYGYGYGYGYGYSYGYGGYSYGKGKVRRTEILMIPQGEDETPPEAAPEESDA